MSFRDGALAPDPESRDSGLAPSARPGMTAYGSLRDFQAAFALASRIASQTFIGEIGVWIEVMPRSASASITPLAMQGGPPIPPDSPQPLAPSGLVRPGAEPSSVTSIGGTSSARGMQ